MEEHPFEPFLPEHARLLMLGTFPPAPKRWCMPFYYPNYQNDMWRIFGICFFGDKTHFLLEEEKRFNLGLIKPFLIEKGIAMYDTAVKVNRTKNTASDKDLQILQPTDLDDMLNRLPCCKAVITAGGHRCILPPLRHRAAQGRRLQGVRLQRPEHTAIPHAQFIEGLSHEPRRQSQAIQNSVRLPQFITNGTTRAQSGCKADAAQPPRGQHNNIQR